MHKSCDQAPPALSPPPSTIPLPPSISNTVNVQAAVQRLRAMSIDQDEPPTITAITTTNNHPVFGTEYTNRYVDSNNRPILDVKIQRILPSQRIQAQGSGAFFVNGHQSQCSSPEKLENKPLILHPSVVGPSAQSAGSAPGAIAMCPFGPKCAFGSSCLYQHHRDRTERVKSESKEGKDPESEQSESEQTPTVHSDNKSYEQYISETMDQRTVNERFNALVEAGEVVVSGSFTCRVDGGCNMTYTSKCHLSRHVSEQHIGRRYKCSICAMHFRQKSQCREHLRNLHFKEPHLWKCCWCRETFTRWGMLPFHYNC